MFGGSLGQREFRVVISLCLFKLRCFRFFMSFYPFVIFLMGIILVFLFIYGNLLEAQIEIWIFEQKDFRIEGKIIVSLCL